MCFSVFLNIADIFLQSDQDAIFIGGGIGIAPFLSMIIETKRVLKGRSISLFYCTKYKSDACFDTELSTYKDKANFYYLNKCSREESRLEVSEIINKVSDINNTLVFICGPNRMNKPIVESLTSLGIPKGNIIAESF